MPIDNVEPRNADVSDETTLRLDRNVVTALKKEAGVTKNAEVAPLAEAAIQEYLGNDPSEHEDKFEAQFEEGEG